MVGWRHPDRCLAPAAITMSEAVTILPPRDVFEQRTVGLVIRGEPTFEEWSAFGSRLGTLHAVMPFWVGDWYLMADRFGEVASQAFGDHYHHQTLQTYGRVCKAIPFDRRRESLSFEHHRAVYKLEVAEQEELFDLAEHSGWGRETLRAEVERRHPARVIGTGGRVSGKPEPAPVGRASEPLPDERLILSGVALGNVPVAPPEPAPVCPTIASAVEILSRALGGVTIKSVTVQDPATGRLRSIPLGRL